MHCLLSLHLRPLNLFSEQISITKEAPLLHDLEVSTATYSCASFNHRYDVSHAVKCALFSSTEGATAEIDQVCRPEQQYTVLYHESLHEDGRFL